MNMDMIFYIGFLLILVVIESVHFGKTKSKLDMFQIFIYSVTIVWYAFQGTTPLFFFITSLLFFVTSYIEMFQMGRLNEDAKPSVMIGPILSVIPAVFSLLIMSGIL